MRERGATIAPPAAPDACGRTNILLQNISAAMLPASMFDLYRACGGIIMGTGYIFGPAPIDRGIIYPVPSIVDINHDMMHIAMRRGKTIFGRNDLFMFGFDAFGKFMMLDNLTLRTLREYESPWRAMTDCLMAGK